MFDQQINVPRLVNSGLVLVNLHPPSAPPRNSGFQFSAATSPLLAFSVAHRQADPAEFGFRSAKFSSTELICIEFIGRVCAISKKRFGIGSVREI